MDIVIPTRLLDEWGSCKWIEKDMWEENDCVEYSSHWRTSCGNNFVIPDGSKPSKHRFEYCPYCGKPIAESTRENE